MAKRTLAMGAFALLGVLTAGATLLGLEPVAQLLFSVMGVSALILLVIIISQLRAEGSTQGRRIAGLRQLIDSDIDRLRTDLYSKNDRLRRAANRNHVDNLARLESIAGAHSEATAQLSLHTETINALSQQLEKLADIVDTNGLDIHHAIAISNQRGIAWQDALRNMVDDLSNEISHLASQVTFIRKSTSHQAAAAEAASSTSRAAHAKFSEQLSDISRDLSATINSQDNCRAQFQKHIDDFYDQFAALSNRHIASVDRLSTLSTEHLNDILMQINANYRDLVDYIDSRTSDLGSQIKTNYNAGKDLSTVQATAASHAMRNMIDMVSESERKLESSSRDNRQRLDDVLSELEQMRSNSADDSNRTFREITELKTTLEAQTTNIFANLEAVAEAQPEFTSDSSPSTIAELEQIKTAIEDSRQAILAQQLKETTKLNIAMYSETQQTEALLRLLPMIEPRWLMPSLGRWALDARAMLHLYQIAMDKRPKTIVELGSGTSTIWLGYIAEKIGATVTSVEHDATFKSRTDYFVNKHNLNDVITTVHAPLEPVQLGNESYRWYSYESLKQLDEIDLLLVDGPVGTTNHWARYPALPRLWKQLSETAIIVLDDIHRTDEVESMASWLEKYPLARIHEGASGLAVLERTDESLKNQAIIYDGQDE